MKLKLKIPVRPKPLIIIYDDGREVRRGRAWVERKREVWNLDGSCCVVCHEPLGFANSETHHLFGRGMNGSKRDDRIFLPDGRRNLDTRCWLCHAKSKMKRRTP